MSQGEWWFWAITAVLSAVALGGMAALDYRHHRRRLANLRADPEPRR